MEMEKEKKEKIALILGFFLILIIILITLFRSKLFTSTDNVSQLDFNRQISSELGYNTINAKDLNKKILLNKKDNPITLLDIRPFDSYIREHIVDTINLTPDDFPLDSKIDIHNQVVVIGADENDEDIKKIVDELKKENFGNFLVLIGGMDSWQKIGGITVTYGDPTLFTDQSKVSYVDPKDLNDALKQDVPMFIVDIGTAEDYSKGHIRGAINIPSDDLEKRRSEITEKKVIVVGPNELQEFQSSVQMYDMLLISPFVLKGAMPQWVQKGYPVVK